MVFPWKLTARLTWYLLKNKLARRKRFPWVLMLEPTFRCNLSCAGCGRIREYSDILDQMMTVEECLGAVAEAGAPVVSITGGEPLLHPHIGEIVNGILARKRFVYLCTNGVALKESLPRLRPDPYFTFVLHLDGLARTHDRIAGREGIFHTAIEGIKAAKKAGFGVRTNTTILKGTDISEVEGLFTLLSELKVDGIMVAPAFSYQAVVGDVFLSRDEMHNLFRPLYKLRGRFRFYNTPLYLEFLAGKRELQCTPWSSPTINPRGWKQPCYLITDGHVGSFAELMKDTPWERYGVGNDPRCANCMVHCGFEASAIEDIGKSWGGLWETVRWNFLS